MSNLDNGSRTVCDLLRWQVRTRPNSVALRTPGREWTYAELDARTARLAARLVRGGVAPGTLVGLLAPRGPAALVGLLAILRCAAACLPLDPGEPEHRTRRVLADAGVRDVLADRRAAWCPEAHLIDDPTTATGRDEPPAPGPRDLAYAITTSGSTGRPKAVAVPHDALFNLVVASIADLGLTPGADVVLWLSRPTVDVTMQDCFMALCSGATLAVPEQGDFLPATIVTSAKAVGASVVDLPAAVVGAYGRSLLPRLARAGVRLVVTGGSQLDGNGLTAAPPVVVNAYGPTEAAVTATTYTCGATTPRRVPIGRPVAGVRTYVLDEGLDPVPTGVDGQLYIAGAGLGWGYLGRPERTATAFVPDPFAEVPGQRMYATGDRVRLRADGDLEFLDRVDNQVKVNGFRVELGEIEHALRDCPGVRDAAAMVRDDASGGAAVIAFLSGRASAPDVIKRRLRDRLPRHMIPANCMWLDALPLNPQGKVDRTVLAGLELPGPTTTMAANGHGQS